MARSLAAALFLGLVCAANAGYTPLFNCPLSPGPGPMAGGISCNAPDSSATAAAAFALQQMAAKTPGLNSNGPLKLEAVVNYGTQVVAGLNRFVTFAFSNSKGQMSVAQAKVFFDLQGKTSLTQAQLLPPASLNKRPTKMANAVPSSTPVFTCAAPSRGLVAGGVTCKPSGPDPAAKVAAITALQAINQAGGFANGPAKLAAVIKPYATQVVAGLNLFVTFVVATSDGVSVAQAEVFQNLQQQQSLSKWYVVPPAATAPGASAAGASTSAAKPADAATSAPKPAAAAAAAAAPPLSTKALFSCPTATMPGGLSCKPADADARKAAAFAVAALNAANAVPSGPVTLAGVDTYATQVVAGTNFFVEFTVKDSKGATKKMQAKVFEALPVYGGKMELTSAALL